MAKHILAGLAALAIVIGGAAANAAPTEYRFNETLTGGSEFGDLTAFVDGVITTDGALGDLALENLTSVFLDVSFVEASFTYTGLFTDFSAFEADFTNDRISLFATETDLTLSFASTDPEFIFSVPSNNNIGPPAFATIGFVPGSIRLIAQPAFGSASVVIVEDGLSGVIASTATVPLPGALPLMLVGLGGFAFFSRRRARAA